MFYVEIFVYNCLSQTVLAANSLCAKKSQRQNVLAPNNPSAKLSLRQTVLASNCPIAKPAASNRQRQTGQRQNGRQQRQNVTYRYVAPHEI